MKRKDVKTEKRKKVILFANELTTYIEKSKKFLWSINETNETSPRLLDIRSI